MTPTVSQALGGAARATLRNAWLAPVGLVVALARWALLVPAYLFAAAILQIAAASWLARLGPLRLPGAALQGVLAAATSPRFLAIVGGLWACGALAHAALRVAYLAGALPSLGASLAGVDPARRFAPGFARGFARLLPAAAVAWVLELTAWAALVAAALGAATLARFGVRGHPALAAALVAAALTLALVAVACSGAVADALLARAALRGEGAPRALARAASRFARRPSAFLAVALVTTAAGAVVTGSAQALGATGAGGGPGSALAALGPQLLANVLAIALGALVELWRLGATAVLACHPQRRR